MMIGIVGSRRRDGITDFERVFRCFLRIYQPGDTIVSGGCPKGADRFAEIIAEVIRTAPVLHLPKEEDLDPVLLQKNPRAAWAKINYARNTLVANGCERMIACVAPDRTGGTEDTIKKFCRRFGIDPRCPSDDLKNNRRLFLV